MKKVFIFIIITILFWGLWSHTNLVATDWRYWFPEELKDGFFFPYLWRNTLGAEGLGQRVFSTIWLWPMTFFFSLGAKLGFSFPSLSRILAIIPIIVVAIYSIDSLLAFLKVKKFARTVAIFLYILNTYFLLLIDGGQLFIAYSYALFPLVCKLFLQALKDKKITSDIKFTLSFLLLTIFDIRISFLFFVFALFRSFYALSTKTVEKKAFSKHLLQLFFLSSISFVGIHAFWILPGIKYLLFNSTFDTLSNSNLVDFNLVNIKHAFLLQQPHWYENIFGVVNSANKFFLLLPALAFAAVFVKKRKKEIWFFVFFALFAIFLAKGTNQPLGEVYTFFYEKLPGFSFFRDSSKFFVLICLSYSLLIAFLFGSITKGKKVINILVYTFVVYLLVLASPVYLDKMTGLFSQPSFENEHFRVAGVIKKDEDFSRSLWIPEQKPLSFSSIMHPAVSAFYLASYRPFTTGTVGRYESQNFLREHPLMGQILEIAGVKYLAYTYPDTKRQKVQRDNIDYYHTFLAQLEKKDWVKVSLLDPPVAVLETKSHADHFFVASNRWTVIGSDLIYWDLADIYGFGLRDNVFVFAEDGQNKIFPDRLREENIFLYKKNKEDLAVNLLPEKNLFFPAQILKREPSENPSKWWKRDSADFVWWRDFLQTKYSIDNTDFDYGGGWAVAEGQKQIQLKSPNFVQGKMLIVRVMESSVGGNISFYQDSDKIGELNTRLTDAPKANIALTGKTADENKTFTYNEARVRWMVVGELFSDQALTIKTDGQINVVNALLTVDGYKWQETEDLADRLIKSGQAVIWEDLSSSEKSTKLSTEKSQKPQVKYRRISPTHYKVEVKASNSSNTLVFSEKYDPLWEISCVKKECGLSNKKPMAVYSLFNGFEVKGGEYDIYFTPQKYVLPGLAVSGLTLLVLVGFLLKYRK